MNESVCRWTGYYGLWRQDCLNFSKDDLQRESLSSAKKVKYCVKLCLKLVRKNGSLAYPQGGGVGLTWWWGCSLESHWLPASGGRRLWCEACNHSQGQSPLHTWFGQINNWPCIYVPYNIGTAVYTNGWVSVIVATCMPKTAWREIFGLSKESLTSISASSCPNRSGGGVLDNHGDWGACQQGSRPEQGAESKYSGPSLINGQPSISN